MADNEDDDDNDDGNSVAEDLKDLQTRVSELEDGVADLCTDNASIGERLDDLQSAFEKLDITRPGTGELRDVERRVAALEVRPMDVAHADTDEERDTTSSGPHTEELRTRVLSNCKMWRETVVDEIQLLIRNQSNFGALLCAMTEIRPSKRQLFAELQDMVREALARSK